LRSKVCNIIVRQTSAKCAGQNPVTVLYKSAGYWDNGDNN